MIDRTAAMAVLALAALTTACANQPVSPAPAPAKAPYAWSLERKPHQFEAASLSWAPDGTGMVLYVLLDRDVAAPARYTLESMSVRPTPPGPQPFGLPGNGWVLYSVKAITRANERFTGVCEQAAPDTIATRLDSSGARLIAPVVREEVCTTLRFVP